MILGSTKHILQYYFCSTKVWSQNKDFKRMCFVKKIKIVSTSSKNSLISTNLCKKLNLLLTKIFFKSLFYGLDSLFRTDRVVFNFCIQANLFVSKLVQCWWDHTICTCIRLCVYACRISLFDIQTR